jgi:hypothetical protein
MREVEQGGIGERDSWIHFQGDVLSISYRDVNHFPLWQI